MVEACVKSARMVSYAPIVEGAMKEVLAIMQRKQEALQAGEPFDEEVEIKKHFEERRAACLKSTSPVNVLAG